MTRLWPTRTEIAQGLRRLWGWLVDPEGPIAITLQVLVILLLAGLAVLGALTLIWAWTVGWIVLTIL